MIISLLLLSKLLSVLHINKPKPKPIHISMSKPGNQLAACHAAGLPDRITIIIYIYIYIHTYIYIYMSLIV